MQWRGSALFFFRVVTPLKAGAGAPGAQTSNILDPACLSGSESIGTAQACIHFSEKSPVISVEITTVVGSDALVRPFANADNSAGYDLTRWKAELSRFLNMPTPDLLYIQGVQPRRGRREEAESAQGSGAERMSHTFGAAQRSTEGAAVGGKSGATNRDSQPRSDSVGGGGRSERRQGSSSLLVQLVILSDIDDPWSYQGFLKSLEELVETEQGRLLLKGKFGVTSLAVGTDPAVVPAATGERNGASMCARECVRVYARARACTCVCTQEYIATELGVGNPTPQYRSTRM
jgi:hypothetical protein